MENKVTADYLDEEGCLHCGICGKRKQMKVSLMGFEHVVSCLCECEVKARQELDEKMQREEAQRQLYQRKSIGLRERRFWEWKFENDNGSNQKILIARQYVENWTDMKRKNVGLLLMGPVGTGKSFFAGCIANALLEQGERVMMTNFSRILNEMTSYQADKNQIIQNLVDYPLLIIDDLGIERNSEFALEQVYNVIDSRYCKMLPLIVTTNLGLNEMKSTDLDTAHQRIYSIYAIIAIVGTITGNWIGMFSFLLPFTILRQYAGGIHLEKPMNCIIFSGFLVFGCGQYLAVASDIGKILCALWVAAILLIFVLAPIDTKGKKLDKTAKKIYGRRARGVLVIEVMIAICFWVCGFIVVTKGIAILTWRGIMNCINATQKLFSITSKDVAFGVTNYGHDMSIFDILGMVYIGGTTVIPNQHNYKNPEIWIDLMNKYKVTVWISVPALLEMLLYSDLEKLPEVVGKLHRVIQGGDYLHIDIVKKFRKWNQKGKIFNVGGPTETTMWNIYHEVSGEDIQNNNIPYGKPFPNTQYYILDKKQELCPVGKEGQMYIAGDGVTPGYVGTGEQGKFTEYKGLRVYCSGDYGVYMRTGEILFRGRKDRQIKINGKRIELDGIEEKLNSIKGITKGAVICKDKRIVAYYVAEDKTEVNNIKKILSGILPEYMIPTAFYEIKRLPYNRNKKVDYRELERMVPKTGEQEKAETELEDFVARICENIFEVEKIGVKESFYNLGGDSVTAMRIAAIIKKEFNVHMTPYDIFEHSTIRELASYIAKLRSDINEKV